MKTFSRKGHATWKGAHGSANGSMTTDSGLLKKASFRVGRRKKTLPGSSPYELLATAHAGCFSMALGEELGHAGFKVCDIGTTATITLEELATGWTMTRMQLDVTARVPRAAQCEFIDAAMRAKTKCPISRLMNANISMTARLLRGPNGGGQAPEPPPRARAR
jgi:osmotically inducible protein OsmC